MSVHAGISLAGYYKLVSSNVNFRRLWIAQLISGMGDWFYSVAIYNLLFELTGSAQAVALAAVLQILPMFIAGPTAGAVNDRVSRRRVMIIADVLRAIVVLGMVAVSRREQLWLLYVLLGMEVMTAAFFEAGRNAIIPNIVGKREIPTANALSSTTWSVTVTAGAGLGGLAVAWLGRPSTLLLNSVSFLVSAAFIRRMRLDEPHLERYGHIGWNEILGFSPITEGIRYVLRDWRRISLLTLKFGLGILGARSVLVAVIGSRELQLAGAPVLGMSALFALQGLGSILGPLAVGPLVGSSESRIRWTIAWGYVAAGLGYMAFSESAQLWQAGLCMIVAHAGGSLVWVFSNTLLHLQVEDRFRGRVFAADLALFMITASVATYLCGWAIDSGVAARTAAFAVGAALLLPAGWWTVSLLWLGSWEGSAGGGAAPHRRKS